jgi:hypothetical protein
MNCLRSLEHWDRGFESHLLYVCAVLCLGSGLAMGWSSVQGVIPTVYRIKKPKNGQGPTKSYITIEGTLWAYFSKVGQSSIFSSAVSVAAYCWHPMLLFAVLPTHTANILVLNRVTSVRLLYGYTRWRKESAVTVFWHACCLSLAWNAANATGISQRIVHCKDFFAAGVFTFLYLRPRAVVENHPCYIMSETFLRVLISWVDWLRAGRPGGAGVRVPVG